MGQPDLQPEERPTHPRVRVSRRRRRKPSDWQPRVFRWWHIPLALGAAWLALLGLIQFIEGRP